MKVKDKLNQELFKQDFSGELLYTEELSHYQEVARNYARLENAIAVLSDMRAKISHIYYGGFAQTLGIKTTDCDKVYTIWEEEILRHVHPDDLSQKYLQELRFFHFIKHQPKSKRNDYYLVNKLRMKNAAGNYTYALHRLFYIPVPSLNSVWLALCLYNPMTLPEFHKNTVVNSTNGQTIELETQRDSRILSEREKQVLRCIDLGMSSKEISRLFSISIHTVSRHRQEILANLQVKNSIEACRIAKELNMI